MKLVKLKSPAFIGGAIRYPSEGPFYLTDAEADHLVDNDKAEFEGEEDELDSLKVAELKALAAEEGIDLGEAKVKAEIIAAIRFARAAQTEE